MIHVRFIISAQMADNKPCLEFRSGYFAYTDSYGKTPDITLTLAFNRAAFGQTSAESTTSVLKAAYAGSGA